MADSDEVRASAQVWGGAVVVASALAVVAAYLINGALLVLTVAGVETLLLMVYVARRWRALHRSPAPESGHRPRRGTPDAAHCERCRRAREALDARQARGRAGRVERPEPRPESAPPAEPLPGLGEAARPPYPHRPQGRAPYERPWTAERAAARSVDRATARRGTPGSAGRAVRHQ
ncbi:hypothetical protein [Streptomyces rubellomurinus]|uniref:Uncharacterized protein n=2 Tax=Streptomyces TaxID=1883 RepID=A0A0F2TEX7_STRR3|nr:hypothetical protein [Streptomyces rubellomurinus]KJS56002.1 hypothetical protein VM98_09625 [Streptomyces rubellomurinus subsp. indigoferus]KJS61066.1 hypothetical protein VM95_17430 [Streptomyces rubellomurinus]